MNILIVSPEAGKFDSALAMTVNRMTKAFSRAGTKVLPCSPFYKAQPNVEFSQLECIYRGTERLHGKPFEIWKKPNSLYLYVYNEEFFGREFIYGKPGEPYSDTHIRFSFMSSAILEYASKIGFAPHAILGHEWGSALTGSLARNLYTKEYEGVPFFLTIHNIHYDFLVSESEIEKLGLQRSEYSMDGYEYWGKVSFLKAGILYAQKVLLPSIGYRDAVLKTNTAGGLTGFLRRNADKLKGIQFGVSYSTWDFNKANQLPLKEAKQRAKAALAQKIGVDIGERLLIYAHLDAESGDTSGTLSTLLSDLAKLDVFILVGLDESFPEWDYYRSVAAEFPNSFCALSLGKTYDTLKAFLAGADVLFAGSLKEPSASILLRALASGTVPVTGKEIGVANMLDPYTEGGHGHPNAFLVDDPKSPVHMLRSIRDCVKIYNTPKWDAIVENAYNFRYEWDRTIAQYLITLGEY